jgi:Tfp pilus assembly protein PilF
MGASVACAAVLLCAPVFAQSPTGALTGRCVSETGAPLAGYKVEIERQDVRWEGHVKTSKKGDYDYIGLPPGMYKITLIAPDGKTVAGMVRHVSIGDPTEVDFDMAKLGQEQAQKGGGGGGGQAVASPAAAQQAVAEQKQSAGLKQVFDAGRAAYAEQHYTEAAADFEKALPLAKDKNIPIVLAQLADTWEKAAGTATNIDDRKKDDANALDYYNKLLVLVPNDSSVHNNLGHLYADMGKSDEAMGEFKKAAELDPDHASTYYYNLGAILVNKGQMDAAADALKKSTDANPQNAGAWYWYGMALMGKAQVKPDGTLSPAPGTLEAFQTYLKLAPTGQYATQAQASIDSLQGKENLEYKKSKK